jgi:predicted HD phosphohydrolase
MTTVSTEARTHFRTFEEMTEEEMAVLVAHVEPYNAALPDRVLKHLRLLEDDNGGFPVTRLEHCLQTATRAERAGRSDEYVFCALIHDIGDTLASRNHPDIAAAIVKPFVSDAHHWMVEKHGIFQTYHYMEKLGGEREQYRGAYTGHEHFDLTAEFCLEFDQNSFDTSYDSLPFEHFVPLVHSVMAAPRAADPL